MHPSHLSALTNRLVSLGFPASVENQLRCHLCFAPTQFELPLTMRVGEDQGVFSVRAERDERGVYLLKYYHACLRKRVEVSEELAGLDQRMAGVDWEAVALGRQLATALDEKSIQEATAVVQALDEFGLAADLLRYKYWQGTSLDSLVLFPSQHKSIWEISERFYFFNEVDHISFPEAIRFLNSRWMERQLQVKKKMAERSSDAEGGDSGRSLLIKKKPRASARKNLLKK
jgi:hypothetical protein